MKEENITNLSGNSFSNSTNDSNICISTENSTNTLPKINETHSLLKKENIEKDITLQKGNMIDYPQHNRIGNMYVWMYDKKGEPLIIIGPHCKH